MHDQISLNFLLHSNGLNVYVILLEEKTPREHYKIFREISFSQEDNEANM